MAACNKALNTVELLENILIQLPAFSLGTALLVSQTWRDVIQCSCHLVVAALTPLRQTISASVKILYDESHATELTINPNLLQVEPPPNEYASIEFGHDRHRRLTKHEFRVRDCGDQGERYDFATAPPVQGILIRCYREGIWSSSRPFMLRAEGGIRLGHIAAKVHELDNEKWNYSTGHFWSMSPEEPLRWSTE